MLGLKKSTQPWHVINLCLTSLLVCMLGCAAAMDSAPKRVDENDPPCGQLLDQFGLMLQDAAACQQDSDCTLFSSAPVGCWHTCNRNAVPQLQTLLKQIDAPRCRVFMPMTKCRAQPTQPMHCRSSRCVWGS